MTSLLPFPKERSSMRKTQGSSHTRSNPSHQNSQDSASIDPSSNEASTLTGDLGHAFLSESGVKWDRK